MSTLLMRGSAAESPLHRRKRRLMATLTGVLLVGMLSGLGVPRAAADEGFQDLTITQRFTSSDLGYGLYLTKNDTVAVELHNPNAASGATYACLVASSTPTGECFGNGGHESEDGDGFAFAVDSSLGQVYVEVDYAADPLASSPEITKVYPVTWTPPTVLTTIPAGPTQAGNVLTFPSETGIDYWVSPTWTVASGSYTMTTTTTVYSAPADGYVFAKPDDYEENGWSWSVPTFRLVTPAAPARYGNVLTIPAKEGVRYTVNGVAVTGRYTLTKSSVVRAQAISGYFFKAGTTAAWSYAPVAVTIKAAALKVTRKPTPRRVGSATFAISSVDGTKVNGPAVLVMVKGAAVKKVAFTVRNGAAAVTVPKLARGTWKFQVRFAANRLFKSKNTVVYTVKVM